MKYHYSDRYRRYHCDMHINDWNNMFFSELDTEKLYEEIKLYNEVKPRYSVVFNLFQLIVFLRDIFCFHHGL